MDSWAFFNAESGDELTRGWQGTEDQARALAQRWANESGSGVEFQTEESLFVPEGADEDWAPGSGEVVDPE